MARHPDFATDLVDFRAPFAGAEMVHLAEEYRRNPAELSCPHCGPGTMEVLGFVEPEPDRNGFAVPAEPRGAYVALLRCLACRRGGSLLLLADEDD